MFPNQSLSRPPYGTKRETLRLKGCVKIKSRATVKNKSAVVRLKEWHDGDFLQYHQWEGSTHTGRNSSQILKRLKAEACGGMGFRFCGGSRL